MRLILVRHPPPQVAAGVCYGGADLPVAAEELERVRASLIASAGLPSDAPIFASPLRRCADLAAALAASLGAGQATLDARLAEMHFGHWEMRSWDDIPRAEVDAWAADLARYRPGGGETVLEVAGRVAAFHAEALRLPHESLIVICHAGTMRLLAACDASLSAEEIALKAAGTAHKIAYGEILVLEH